MITIDIFEADLNFGITFEGSLFDLPKSNLNGSDFR
jgi:hypothetical protein